MMSLEDIMAALADRNLSVVAKNTGISYGTLHAIKTGTANPTAKTMQKLDAYLRAVCKL
jgi:DNA-binding phage protein